MDEHRETCLEVLVDTRCKLADSLDLVPQSRVIAIFATVRQRDSERLPKAVRYRRHSKASTADGPWPPLVLMVALRMACASILSNIEGWYGSVFGQSSLIRAGFYDGYDY